MVELSDIKDEITKAWNTAKEESGFEFRAVCAKYIGDTNVDQYIQETIVSLKDYRDNGGLGNLYINTYPKPNFFDDSKTALYHIGILSDDNLNLIATHYYNYYKNYFSDCSSDETVKSTSYRCCYGFFVKIQTVKRLLDLLDEIYEARNNKQKTVYLKLKEDKAQSIFKKAIIEENPIIYEDADGYIWKGDKQLLAYFAEKMSLYLSLTSKMDKDGKKTVSWIPFEKAFGIRGLKIAKNSWMKYNTKFTPTGYERVDKWFE